MMAAPGSLGWDSAFCQGEITWNDLKKRGWAIMMEGGNAGTRTLWLETGAPAGPRLGEGKEKERKRFSWLMSEDTLKVPYG